MQHTLGTLALLTILTMIAPGLTLGAIAAVAVAWWMTSDTPTEAPKLQLRPRVAHPGQKRPLVVGPLKERVAQQLEADNESVRHHARELARNLLTLSHGDYDALSVEQVQQRLREGFSA